MNIRILSCAEQELAEAVDYYNEQSPGLGYEFAAEVKAALDRIASFPRSLAQILPTHQKMHYP